MFTKKTLLIATQVVVLGAFVVFAASSGTDGSSVSSAASSASTAAYQMAGWDYLGHTDSSYECEKKCEKSGNYTGYQYMGGKCYCM